MKINLDFYLKNIENEHKYQDIKLDVKNTNSIGRKLDL